MQAVQLLTYAALAIGLLAMLVKVYRYATAPEHMRWELYPVPHEKGRSEYGGSYLEELDWWTKARHTDFFNEIKEMALEIILLKGVFNHNRSVWTWSLPFHLGLYICIGWQVLMAIGAIMIFSGVEVAATAGGFGAIVHYLTVACGFAGLVLSGVGALGLFFWRAGSSQQRGYSAPIEFFNLIFFVVTAAVALFTHATIDPAFAGLRAYIGSVITFSSAAPLTGWLATEIVLGAVLMMYIPLTRMSHFVAKYFLYHAVRWNDEANERGSKIEKRIIEQLGQKVGWNAPHIQTGKTWADVVKEPKK